MLFFFFSVWEAHTTFCAEGHRLILHSGWPYEQTHLDSWVKYEEGGILWGPRSSHAEWKGATFLSSPAPHPILHVPRMAPLQPLGCPLGVVMLSLTQTRQRRWNATSSCSPVGSMECVIRETGGALRTAMWGWQGRGGIVVALGAIPYPENACPCASSLHWPFAE